MPSIFELEEQAKNDFWETFEYYSKIDPDLAFQFSNDFDKSVEQLLQFPKSGLPIGSNLSCSSKKLSSLYYLSANRC